MRQDLGARKPQRVLRRQTSCLDSKPENTRPLARYLWLWRIPESFTPIPGPETGPDGRDHTSTLYLPQAAGLGEQLSTRHRSLHPPGVHHRPSPDFELQLSSAPTLQQVSIHVHSSAGGERHHNFFTSQARRPNTVEWWEKEQSRYGEAITKEDGSRGKKESSKDSGKTQHNSWGLERICREWAVDPEYCQGCPLIL